MPKRGQELIEELYHAIENEMLVNIGKRIGNGQGVATSDILSWQVNKLSQLGNLRTEQLKVLAKYTGMTLLELKKFIRDTSIAALNEFDTINKPLIDAMGGYIEPEGNIYERLLALERQATKDFNLINTNLIGSSEQVYVDIVTKAAAKVLTGNGTLVEAVKDVARQWGEKGIPALVDKRGAKWSVEAYVRMVVLNTEKNTAMQMQEDRFEEYEIDLVEISSHVGSRPTHIDYQGRIFSRSGTDKKYPALSSTSYGAIDGIITGINCRHIMYGFIDGLSIQRNFPYDKEVSIAKYKQSQMQRKYEREIRKAKKQKLLLENMGVEKKDVQAAQTLISKRQKRMREFIKESGRTRRYNREQIQTP